MFGAGTISEDTASIWLLASDNILKSKRDFLIKSKKMIRALKKKYKKLVNAVDVNNSVYINWLKHLGFKFQRTITTENGTLYLFSD